MKTERDIKSIIWTAEMRGMERGMEKGRQEQSIIFAMNLKSDGFSYEIIAKYTGLSIEQIKQL